jgi:C-terminal binding protein
MASKKPVVLYPEGLYPDLSVETPIFGPEVELRMKTVENYSQLTAEDRNDVTGLMVFRYRVTAEDMALFPNLKAIVRMGVGYDRLDRVEAARRDIKIMK